jgi:glutaredoxin
MKTNFVIEIFTQDRCQACNQVKQLFNARNLIYKTYEIDKSAEAKADFFNRLPSARTVPQVFIDGRYIGGLEETVKELYTNDYF